MTDARDQLSYHEQMLDAQAGCVPCKLCGGAAVISDAGCGAGYHIRCGNSLQFRESRGCMITDRRLGGWAYNVMDWWNRLHAQPVPSPARDDSAEIARIVCWIDEAVGRAETHSGTEGIWLFGNQWRIVRDILTATPAPNYKTAWEALSGPLLWMHESDRLKAYWGWNLADIANDLIDRAYPGLRTGKIPAPGDPA
jgi:hypothetical protein